MGKKYSVGDKVVTADNWNDGMGRIIPKGSVVEIIRDFEYGGINMYDCEYNGGCCIYEEQWLGDKYVNPKIGGWIPCSERLPEENEEVICCFKSGVVKALVLFNCKFHGKVYAYEKSDIIAWQPLPEAYHG